MLLDMSGEILDVDVVLVEGWLVVEVRVNFIFLLDVTFFAVSNDIWVFVLSKNQKFNFSSKNS